MVAYIEELACKKNHVSHSALKPEISISNQSLPLVALIQDLEVCLVFPLLFRKMSVLPDYLFLQSFSLT